jgi:hypothetical protein
MNEINCETILMTKMAEFDGEESILSTGQINSHLAVCEYCQNHLGELRITDDLLKRQTRRASNPNIWEAIEKRLGPKTTSSALPKPFILVGVSLFVYKLLEIFPNRDLGLAFKLVPLIFIIALFVFLKENPFKVNVELKSQRSR